MAQVPTTDVTTISVGGSAYTVPFLYQNQAEVFVEVDGVATAFTWINSGNISITPAPVAGAKVRRYRSTAATSIRHDFRNGVPFTPKNITENNDQLLYVVQEAVNDTAGTADAALTQAEQAVATADAAAGRVDVAVDLIDAALQDSALYLRNDLANATDPAKGAGMVGFATATGGATKVADELKLLGGSLPDLVGEPAAPAQDLRYLRDSIGLGYSNGALHLNGNLQIGAIRNLLSATEDLSLISATNMVKDATRSIKFRGMTLQRAYGSNFFSQLMSNLGGTGVVLTVRKKYLASCYIINLAETEKFVWMRPITGGGEYGHGAKLVDRNVRRIWCLVQATATGSIDPITNPTVALGSGTGLELYWTRLHRSNESLDLRIGGFQLEQVPDDTKMGVAVIGDSTVAGSSGKKDLAASTEWTRWAEAVLNVPFFNRGVGGETTASMRARWATDMTPLAVNATHAIIQGGINDIAQGRTLADIQADLLWMHDQAITDGMQPVVCTCTPTSSIQAEPAKESMRQQLNAWIKTTFALMLDLDKVVRDQRNPSLLRQKAGWVGDGIHFDNAAKRAIGIYVAAWPYWDFLKPSPYQARTGNASSVDPVRAGSLFHIGSGYSVFDVAGSGSLNLKNDTRLTAQVLEFSGALTGARTTYIQGFIPKLWFVRNATSGTYDFNLGGVNSSGSATGATILIGQGKGCWVLSTGAGLVRASADV